MSKIVLAAAALVIAATTQARAQAAASVITACVVNGAPDSAFYTFMRYVKDPSECLDSEFPVQWNTRGPQGEQGPQGPQGPAGPGATLLEVTNIPFQWLVEGSQVLARLPLSPGLYVVYANLGIDSTLSATCYLVANDNSRLPAFAYITDSDPRPHHTAAAGVSLQIVVNTVIPNAARLVCETLGGGRALNTHLFAIRMTAYEEVPYRP